MLRIPRKKKKKYKNNYRRVLGYDFIIQKSSIEKDPIDNIWGCIIYPKVPWKK